MRWVGAGPRCRVTTMGQREQPLKVVLAGGVCLGGVLEMRMVLL